MNKLELCKYFFLIQILEPEDFKELRMYTLIYNENTAYQNCIVKT